MTLQTSYTNYEPRHIECVRKVINLLMPQIVGTVRNRRTGMVTAIQVGHFLNSDMDWDFGGATKYEVVDEIIDYLLTRTRLARIQEATRQLEDMREWRKYTLRNDYTWLY